MYKAICQNETPANRAILSIWSQALKHCPTIDSTIPSRQCNALSVSTKEVFEFCVEMFRGPFCKNALGTSMHALGIWEKKACFENAHVMHFQCEPD